MPHDDDGEDRRDRVRLIGTMAYDDRTCQIYESMVLSCLDHVDKNCEMNGTECFEAYDWCMREGLIAGTPFVLTQDGIAWLAEYFDGVDQLIYDNDYDPPRRLDASLPYRQRLKGNTLHD